MKKVINIIFYLGLILLLVDCPGPAPVLLSLSPDSMVAHLPTFTLTAMGTDFSTDSRIIFDGVEKLTTFISSTELTCEINPEDIPTGPTTKPVLVRGPGGDSATLNFTVETNHSFITPIKLTNNSAWYESKPRIVINTEGSIYVVWDRWNTPNGQDNEVYFKKSTDGGASWSTEVNVSKNGSDYSSWSEIDVDSAGNIYVVWVGKELYDLGLKMDIFISRSTNTGTTWSTGLNISNSGYTSRDPDIAVDSSGNINVVWNEEDKHRVMFSRSVDGGLTWSFPVMISFVYFSFRAEPAIAIDIDDNLNVVWYDDSAGTGNYEINFSRSTDKGINWIPAVKVNSGPYYSRFPHIAADSSGNLHVVWSYSGVNNQDIVFSKSDDNGTSWSIAGTVYNINQWSSWYPRMAVDTAGNINVVWYDGTFLYPDHTDLLFNRSIDNGYNWQSPMDIYNIGYNSDPDLALYSGGFIHVVWSHNTSENTTDIYYFNSVQ